LVAAVAAADNATHTVIATVLNERYVPLFELWHPHFAAATDSDAVELVVACLDPAAAAAVRRLDKKARTLDATTGTRHDVWAARLAKVLAVAHLVNEERAGSRRPVVLSDVDAFWLASPIASLRRIDAALVFSLDRVPTGASAPAGFDTNRGVTLCSGFFLARPTEKTTALLVAWRRRIVAAGSDQVAANALYDDVGGKGFAVIREEVQRFPSAVPAVWHPYSPSRVETKVTVPCHYFYAIAATQCLTGEILARRAGEDREQGQGRLRRRPLLVAGASGTRSPRHRAAVGGRGRGGAGRTGPAHGGGCVTATRADR